MFTTTKQSKRTIPFLGRVSLSALMTWSFSLIVMFLIMEWSTLALYRYRNVENLRVWLLTNTVFTYSVASFLSFFTAFIAYRIAHQKTGWRWNALWASIGSLFVAFGGAQICFLQSLERALWSVAFEKAALLLLAIILFCWTMQNYRRLTHEVKNAMHCYLVGGLMLVAASSLTDLGWVLNAPVLAEQVLMHGLFRLLGGLVIFAGCLIHERHAYVSAQPRFVGRDLDKLYVATDENLKWALEQVETPQQVETKKKSILKESV